MKTLHVFCLNLIQFFNEALLYKLQFKSDAIDITKGFVKYIPVEISVTYNGSERNIPATNSYIFAKRFKKNSTSFARMTNFKYIKVFDKDDESSCYSFSAKIKLQAGINYITEDYTLCSRNDSCIEIFSNSSKHIINSSNYPKTQSCLYILKNLPHYTLHLQFKDIQLQLKNNDCKDYIRLSSSELFLNESSKLCGKFHDIWRYFSYTEYPYLLIEFYSDSKSKHVGFFAKFWRIKEDFNCSRTIILSKRSINLTNDMPPSFSNSQCTITLISQPRFNIFITLKYLYLRGSNDELVIIDKENNQRKLNNKTKTFSALSNSFKIIFQSTTLQDSLDFHIEGHLILECYDTIAGYRGTISFPNYHLEKSHHRGCSYIIKSNNSNHRIELRYSNPNLSEENRMYLFLLQEYIEVRSGKNQALIFLTNSSTLKFLYFKNETNIEEQESIIAYWKFTKLGCPRDWEEFDDSCWKVFTEKLNWFQAKSKCERNGGFLSELTNSQKNSIVINYLSNDIIFRHNHREAFWLGMKNKKWLRCQSSIFQDWFPGILNSGFSKEPSDDGLSGDHCLELRKEFPSRNQSLIMNRYYWADRNCQNTKNFFICETIVKFEDVDNMICYLNILIGKNQSCIFTIPNSQEYDACKYAADDQEGLQLQFKVHSSLIKKKCEVYIKPRDNLRQSASVNSTSNSKRVPRLFSVKNITNALYLSSYSGENDGFRALTFLKNDTEILDLSTSFVFVTFYSINLNNNSCDFLDSQLTRLNDKQRYTIEVEELSTVHLKFDIPSADSKKYCYFCKLTIFAQNEDRSIVAGKFVQDLYITNMIGTIIVEILTDYNEDFKFLSWEQYRYSSICRDLVVSDRIVNINRGLYVPHSLCCFNLKINSREDYQLTFTQIYLFPKDSLDSFVQVNNKRIYPPPKIVVVNDHVRICTQSAAFEMTVAKINNSIQEDMFVDSNEEKYIHGIVSMNVKRKIQRRIVIRTRLKHRLVLTKMKSIKDNLFFIDQFTPDDEHSTPLTNNTSYLHEVELKFVEEIGNSLDNFTVRVESMTDNEFEKKSMRHFNISVGNCNENPCKEPATCQNYSTYSTCKCSAGYFGLLCSWSHCSNSPCNNSGNCTATSDNDLGFFCNCPKEYFGRYCEQTSNMCRKKRCSNAGECKGRNECICDNRRIGTSCDQLKDIRNSGKDPFVKLLQEPFWFGIVVVLVLSLAAASSFALRRKCSKQADKLRKKIILYWRSRHSKNFEVESNPEQTASKRPSFEYWDRCSVVSQEERTSAFPNVFNLLQSWQDSIVVEEVPQPTAEQRRIEFVDAVRRSRISSVSTIDSCDSSSIDSRRRKRKRSNRKSKTDCSSTDTVDSRKLRRRKKQPANRKLVRKTKSLDSNNESTTSGFGSDRLAEVDNKQPLVRMLSMIADEEEQQNKSIFFLQDRPPIALYGERVTEL
ncbi:DgyrCDS10984 [Dimorphilus gyrociliatus]|uniref:DgyrCDS10984 n=1 Tax=Dimorphilus gyrociliatus TaxID=2664684 RepID=A0A7I8W6Z9_9ANNE|nr:DgyrCDS10984 [Dimorphilus gyrociliatus]